MAKTVLNDDEQTLRSYLRDRARLKLLAPYQDAGAQVGLSMANPDHRRTLGQLLGRINQYEVDAGRPLLSAIVVYTGAEDLVGSGFFDYAESIGRLSPTANRDEQQEFHAAEVTKVHDLWSDRRNRGVW